MASSNSSTGPADGLPRVGSTGRAAAPGKSDDPEVRAAEIEQTREDLAETLDAIADKVSPKRVTHRTKKKVADAAKNSVHDAADTVKEKAAMAGDSLKDAAGALKEKATEAGDSLKDSAGGAGQKAGSASGGVPDVEGSMTSIEAHGETQTEFAVDAVPGKPGAVTITPDVQRPSVAPIGGNLPTETPPSLKPGGSPSALAPVAQSRGPMLAGAAAAVAVLLLLLRRRRH